MGQLLIYSYFLGHMSVAIMQQFFCKIFRMILCLREIGGRCLSVGVINLGNTQARLVRFLAESGRKILRQAESRTVAKGRLPEQTTRLRPPFLA